MGNLTYATMFMVLVNVLMWFSAIAMLSINPTGSICYNIEGSIIGNTITGTGDSTILNNDALSELPNPTGSVTVTTNPFTDIFNNILSWFKTAPGIRYVTGVVAAPYNILKCMNLPVEFSVGIGTLWYLVSFLILVAFLWGRD
jgi:hypothetical protein